MDTSNQKMVQYHRLDPGVSGWKIESRSFFLLGYRSLASLACLPCGAAGGLTYLYFLLLCTYDLSYGR
jgi:hypothetical protein